MAKSTKMLEFLDERITYLNTAVEEAQDIMKELNDWTFIEPIAGLDTRNYKLLIQEWLKKYGGTK